MNLRKMATLSLLEGKKKNRQEIEQDHNTSRLATGDPLPSGRLHLLKTLKLPKQYHQLGTKYPSTWDYEGKFQTNYNTFLISQKSS